MAFNQADSATFARLAARRYLSFSAGVTRRCICSVAGSATGGLPRGRLGLSMAELSHTQKRLDKPLQSDILYTQLITKEPKMTNHQAAAKASKSGSTFFVVYVPDEGQQVFSAEQMKTWAPLVFVEAAYLNGQRIAQ